MKPAKPHFKVLGIAPHLSGRRLREQGVVAVAPNLMGVAAVSPDGRDACLESQRARGRREQSDAAEQGPISKLLTCLESRGLLESTGGDLVAGNAWQFTPRGEELRHVSQVKEQAK